MKVSRTKLREAFWKTGAICLSESWIGNGQFMLKREYFPEIVDESSAAEFMGRVISKFVTRSDAEIAKLIPTYTVKVEMTQELYSPDFGSKFTSRKYASKDKLHDMNVWINEHYADMFDLRCCYADREGRTVTDSEEAPTVIIARFKKD